MNALSDTAHVLAPPAVRVLQVVHGLPRGGLENGVVNLLNGLPRTEFQQRVACLDNRGDMADRVSPQVPIDVLDRRRHDLGLPLRLARLIRDFRPHVVHCRNWNTWADTVLAHRLARCHGTLVWSFHGFADGHWFPRRRRLASRALSLATDRLFAVCRDAAERFAVLTDIPPERFDVLYNGVDCRRFAPCEHRAGLRRALGLADDELVILSVASLTPVKGHARLLEAAAQVLAGTRRRVRFLWLGEGAERARLEARIRALQIDERVNLPGGSDRVPQHLAAADLFVLPSELEGMSNAILEAMASGLPVVAHAVGGNPELVDHEHSGLLCPAGDANALAAAIGRLVRNDAERAAMGAAARRRAEQIFSLDAMLMRYADFYRHAVPVLPGRAAAR
ncbi:MAG: glycosyltransferase [Thiohalocapsa sp.]|uniref:glycosyltransferase n=1 Tax=Thiohalocapsa sp. TaxID=2497641 RepID=UPI0025F9D6D7|nr:glycosyltransferase [Thiohalocapsa sp.]MCG6940282.1 glycosyltransferase [Thiohalocapsa sp.]